MLSVTSSLVGLLAAAFLVPGSEATLHCGWLNERCCWKDGSRSHCKGDGLTCSKVRIDGKWSSYWVKRCIAAPTDGECDADNKCVAGKGCFGGECKLCGGASEACCPDVDPQWSCMKAGDGFVCGDADTCVRQELCGALNQSPCPDRHPSCDEGLKADGDVCVPDCGKRHGDCCPAGATDRHGSPLAPCEQEWTTCDAAICVDCGLVGQKVCAHGPPCQPGQGADDGTGLCALVCGEEGEACCKHSTSGSGHLCNEADLLCKDSACQACGDAGEALCYNDWDIEPCTSEHQPHPCTWNTCVPKCGGLGEPKCTQACRSHSPCNGILMPMLRDGKHLCLLPTGGSD